MSTETGKYFKAWPKGLEFDDMRFKPGVLAGMNDSDGSVVWSNGKVTHTSYTTVYEDFKNGLVKAARSLGIRTSVSLGQRDNLPNGRGSFYVPKPAYQFGLSAMSGLNSVIANSVLTRKHALGDISMKPILLKFNCETIEGSKKECYGFTLEGNASFMTDELVVAFFELEGSSTVVPEVSCLDYIYRICGDRSISISRMMVHVYSHFNVRKFRCGECSQQFKGQRSLLLHYERRHHKGSKEPHGYQCWVFYGVFESMDEHTICPFPVDLVPAERRNLKRRRSNQE